MADILLFLWAKYMSQICKLVTDMESKTTCLSTGPVTMSNYKKIQETVRLRNITLPVDLLPGDTCQAVREHIDHKDLCKDHEDLN
ncbi:hypothetical protein Y1Q_0013308 [Alligator mississippiensis]|uniref:Uncharacterized protein n=1 Tax=Alligator mississippiensis TaxID=8496 RepID=A0A151NTA9_ALLMI|nr:hypothetical protein Y1Q_0013308 [Alligator mississippiensis]